MIQLFQGLAFKDQLDVGILGLPAGDQRLNFADKVQPFNDADAQRPRQRAVLLLGFLQSLGEVIPAAGKKVPHGDARRRQPELGLDGAVEQPDPQLCLQIGDLFAQGGLGDIQLRRGFGEAHVLDDTQKIVDLQGSHRRHLPYPRQRGHWQKGPSELIQGRNLCNIYSRLAII